MKIIGSAPSNRAEKDVVEILEKNLANMVGHDTQLYPKVYGGRFSDRDLEIFLFVTSNGSKIWKEKIQVDNACMSIEVKSHRQLSFESSSNVSIIMHGDRKYPVEQARQSSQELKRILSQNVRYAAVQHVFYFACFPNIDSSSLEKNALDQARKHCQWPYVLFRDDLTLERILGKLREQWLSMRKSDLGPVQSLWWRDQCSMAYELPQAISGVKQDVVLGAFDKHRFERIANSKINVREYLEALDDGDVIIRGKAGSGKSVCAIKLAVEYYKRGMKVLLCTYNVALANDLDLLFHYHEQNEMIRLDFENGKVGSVNIINIDRLVHDYAEVAGHYVGSVVFSADYDEQKRRWRESIRSLMAELGETEVRGLIECDFDIVVIDEAQDVEKEDLVLLNQLLKKGVRCVYVDSPDQTLRSLENNSVKGVNASEFTRNTVYRNYRKIAKYSKRIQRQLPTHLQQKDDLVDPEYDGYDDVYNELEDGYVEILDYDTSQVESIVRRLVNESKSASYDAWATMVIVPGAEEATHVMKCLQAEGIKTWNGTDKEIRAKEYDPTCVRVIDYRSCRGLEAYNVVLYRPDLAIQRDMKHCENVKKGSILASNQIFIALSRAINSLSIVVPSSSLRGLFERALQNL
jgi:hypothetical protein